MKSIVEVGGDDTSRLSVIFALKTAVTSDIISIPRRLPFQRKRLPTVLNSSYSLVQPSALLNMLIRFDFSASRATAHPLNQSRSGDKAVSTGADCSLKWLPT